MSHDPRLTSLQLWPALDPATESALRESIRRWGVLVPVAKDQHGRTLDGHHRARIADDIGETYAVIVHHVADDDEARELARTLNSDRRHLTTEQRRDMVAHLRELGHSYRAIGAALGVDPMTARKDAMDSGVESSTPAARVVGADGKSYPARRPTVFAANDGEAARASAKMAMLPLDALPIGPSTAADVERSVRLVKEARREERRDENRQAIATAPPPKATPGDTFVRSADCPPGADQTSTRSTVESRAAAGGLRAWPTRPYSTELGKLHRARYNGQESAPIKCSGRCGNTPGAWSQERGLPLTSTILRVIPAPDKRAALQLPGGGA